MLVRSIGALLVGLVLGVACAGGAAASGAIWVWNLTDVYVTVNIDGAYGCNTSAGSQCTIPISDGWHHGTADTAYGRLERDIEIDNNTIRWCIYTTDDANAQATCSNWLNQ